MYVLYKRAPLSMKKSWLVLGWSRVEIIWVYRWICEFVNVNVIDVFFPLPLSSFSFSEWSPPLMTFTTFQEDQAKTMAGYIRPQPCGRTSSSLDATTLPPLLPPWAPRAKYPKGPSFQGLQPAVVSWQRDDGGRIWAISKRNVLLNLPLPCYMLIKNILLICHVIKLVDWVLWEFHLSEICECFLLSK